MTRRSKGVSLANAVLIGAVIFCAVLLAFTIRGHDRFFTTMDSIGLFYGVPLLGIIILVALLFSYPIIRINAAITLIFCAVVIYGFETYLSTTPVAASSSLPPGSDLRTKVEVVNDLRAGGQDAYPAVFPAYLLKTQVDGTMGSPISIVGEEVLPLAGIPEVPSVLCNESGQWVSFNADSLGFNNPPDAWQAANVSLLAIGDSFVQGHCVSPADTFVELIRNKHGRVLNVATSGSGPLIELAVLREYGPRYRPPVVLWFFVHGNDFSNLSIEKRSLLLMKYLDSGFSQKLLQRRQQVGNALRGHLDQMYAKGPKAVSMDAGPVQRVISFVGLSQLRQRLFSDKAHGQRDYPLFERILKEAQKTVTSWNGELVFVYLPTWGGATRDELVESEQEIRDTVFPMLRKHQIPLFDLLEAFSTHPDPASLFAMREPNHYSEAGHRLVSRIVIEKLAEQTNK